MCKNVCNLCPNLIISTAVTFTGGNLVVTIPDGSYINNQKYCIIVAQSIPSATTVNAPVLVQIGTGTQLYQVLKCNCRPLTACGLRSRRKYSMRLETTPSTAIFRLLGDVCCPSNDLASVNGTAPVTTAPETSNVAAK